MAERFGVLPSQAARDLDGDPSRLSLTSLELLEYAGAKAAYDTRKKKVMEAYHNQRMLRRVTEIAHEMAEEEPAADSAAEAEIVAQDGTS